MSTIFKKNFPIEEYHQRDGALSASRLKQMLKSPLHFKYPPESKAAAYFDIGSAVHTLLLEPHLFEKEYFIYDESKRPKPEQNFSQKDNKEWKAAIFEKNENKIILSNDQKEQCETMAERVLEDPFAKELLSGPGWNEASIWYWDHKRKVRLKTRPDRLRANMVIIDIKTAADASPKGFGRALGNFRYDIQAAMQIDGVERHFKKKVPYYFYIVIEKTPPYAYGVYLLKSDTIWTGRTAYKQLLDIYKECKEKDEWPSYSYWAKQLPDKILRTELPHYTKTSLFQY